MAGTRGITKKGSDNFRSRLSEDEVLTIYHDTKLSQTELASRYRVRQATISHIKNGKTWRWLTKHDG